MGVVDILSFEKFWILGLDLLHQGIFFSFLSSSPCFDFSFSSSLHFIHHSSASPPPSFFLPFPCSLPPEQQQPTGAILVIKAKRYTKTVNAPRLRARLIRRVENKDDKVRREGEGGKGGKRRVGMGTKKDRQSHD